MPIEKIIYFALAVLCSFVLGFILGCARTTSKYVRKQRSLTRRVQVLETWKKAVKALCPKIKDEEDIEIKADYLPEKINGKIIVAPMENAEDEDTKTAELEIVRQGDPRDF